METRYALIREQKDIPNIVSSDKVFDFFVSNKLLRSGEYTVIRTIDSLDKAEEALSKFRCRAKKVQRYNGNMLECELYYLEHRNYDGEKYEIDSADYKVAPFFDPDLYKINEVARELLQKGVDMPDDIDRYVQKKGKSEEYRKELFNCIDSDKHSAFCSSCDKKYDKDILKRLKVNNYFRTDVYGKIGSYCPDCIEEEKQQAINEEDGSPVIAEADLQIV